MSYETDVVVNVDELLDKLQVFASADGWTINSFRDTLDGVPGKELYLSKAGVGHFALKSDNTVDPDPNKQSPTPSIISSINTGFDASGNYGGQPGYSGHAGLNAMYPPFQAYHFFSDAAGTYIHVVLELTPGVFSHFGLGMVEKAFPCIGGEYVYGSFWDNRDTTMNDWDDTAHAPPFSHSQLDPYKSTRMRFDVDGVVNRQFSPYRSAENSRDTLFMATGMRVDSLLGDFLGNASKQIAPNIFNDTPTIYPSTCILKRGTTSNLAQIFGEVKDFGYCALWNNNPGDVIAFGSEEWVLFPIRRLVRSRIETLDGTPSSYVIGIAYKKIP